MISLVGHRSTVAAAGSNGMRRGGVTNTVGIFTGSTNTVGIFTGSLMHAAAFG